MKKVIITNHPVIKHKLSIIRDVNTPHYLFNQLVNEVGKLMAYEATKDLETKKVNVETPLQVAECEKLLDNVVIVPILRAGLGMADGVCEILPHAKIGHLGLYRDEETLETKEYLNKLPATIKDSVVLLVDPMLATGNTVVYASGLLKKAGVKKIIYIGLVGVDCGIDKVHSIHPDVDIYLAAKDEKLNDKAYILPGLGDCGDRLFGTK